MKRRDKQISMKVNSDLINKFNVIIDRVTRKVDLGYKTLYSCTFPDKPHSYYDKYTIADLLEEALRDFIKKYDDVSAVKSNT